MNIVYLIGIVLAVAFTIFGIIVGISINPGETPMFSFSFAPDSLWNFFDLSSVLIVVGGTLAVVIACYPKLAKSFPKHIKIMLQAKAFDPTMYVDQLVELAQIARKNGLLALEEKANDQSDPFFRQAIMLIVDANDPDRVRSILENDIEQTSARHQEVVAMYERGSNAAPAFGMIGTLIGLINMLKSLSDADMNSLGPNMSVALVTTFYGSFLAHVIFNPIAANLTARDEEEILCRQIVVEGIMAIQSGENPKFLRERLLTFINQKQRDSSGDEAGAKPKGSKRQKKDKG
ncbi:motility protein A [uncultured Pseudoflavonifractor sp.]|uniref:motility protein A n=1 Tax=uncultured Pseudoflavonifractor sp. TaxID=1221379 RepID=UPI0025FF5B58|nr:motility protein A [uncultured Pseudoflavonifractor sp.]